VLSSPHKLFVSSPHSADTPLPELIKRAREQAILSQRELADHLGCSVRSVQAWEAGVTPQPRLRRALVEFLVDTAPDRGLA
jgi:DNA-binding transcriptional regulator YiaG